MNFKKDLCKKTQILFIKNISKQMMSFIIIKKHKQ